MSVQTHKNQVQQGKTDTVPSSTPPITQPTSPSPTIEPKSNAEGLAEHAERLKKFQRLDSNMVQMGPPHLGHSNPIPIQPKLTIGAPGDKYEQEADRVAKRVVTQIHSPKSLDTPSFAQRQDLPERDELMMKPIIQRHNGPKDANPNLEQAINQSRGGGRPLDDKIRGPMEQAFGANFGNVRVHNDTKAHQLNESIQARAFTTGQDLFFRQGAYQPSNPAGQELLAHELTHVVQQTGRQQINRTQMNRGNQGIIQRVTIGETMENYLTQHDGKFNTLAEAYSGFNESITAEKLKNAVLETAYNLNSEILLEELSAPFDANYSACYDTAASAFGLIGDGSVAGANNSDRHESAEKFRKNVGLLCSALRHAAAGDIEKIFRIEFSGHGFILAIRPNDTGQMVVEHFESLAHCASLIESLSYAPYSIDQACTALFQMANDDFKVRTHGASFFKWNAEALNLGLPEHNNGREWWDHQMNWWVSDLHDNWATRWQTSVENRYNQLANITGADNW